MPIASGSAHGLYYVPEVIAGTTPETPELVALRHTGCTLGVSRDSFQSKELRSDRQIAGVRTGADKVAGNIEFELSYGEFDPLFAAVFCNEWQGNILKAGVLQKSLTFQRSFGDIGEHGIYRGCYINKFSLSVKPNNIITGSFEVSGLSAEYTDEGLDDSPTASQTYDVFDSFTGVLKEGGTEIAIVTGLDISLDNGITPQFCVGSRDAAFVTFGRSTASGTITAFFENSTLLQKFLSETSSSLEFTFGTGLSKSYKLLLPAIRYTGADNPVSDEGPISLSLPFMPVLDPVTGTNIQLTRIA